MKFCNCCNWPKSSPRNDCLECQSRCLVISRNQNLVFSLVTGLDWDLCTSTTSDVFM